MRMGRVLRGHPWRGQPERGLSEAPGGLRSREPEALGKGGCDVPRACGRRTRECEGHVRWCPFTRTPPPPLPPVPGASWARGLCPAATWVTSSALQAGAERSWVIAAVAGTPPRALGRVSSCLRLPHTWVEKDEGPTLSPRCLLTVRRARGRRECPRGTRNRASFLKPWS